MISFLIEKDSKQSTASQVKDPPLLLSLSGIGSTGEVSNLFLSDLNQYRLLQMNLKSKLLALFTRLKNHCSVALFGALPSLAIAIVPFTFE